MKLSKILTLGVFAGMLAGCSNNSLTREQAIEKLESYAKHDFTTQLKSTTNLKQTTTTAGLVALNEYEETKTVVHEKVLANALGGSYEKWSFLKDNHYYVATLISGSTLVGQYTEIEDATLAQAAYNLKVSDLLVSFYRACVETYYELAGYLHQLPTGAHEQYKEEAEGKLSINYDDSEKSTVVVCSTENYVPTSFTLTYDGETVSAINKFNEANIELPDLTNAAKWQKVVL